MIVCWAGASVLAVAAAAPSLAQSLTVATDSSLGPGMKAVVQGFEAAHAGVSVKLLLGASGALLEQIAEGTSVDVLAGADAETVALGVQRRLLVSDLRSVFATNALVLIVPASLNLPVQRLSDLAQTRNSPRTRHERCRRRVCRIRCIVARRIARAMPPGCAHATHFPLRRLD